MISSLQRSSPQNLSDCILLCLLQLITSQVVDQQDADRLTIDQVPDEDADIDISDSDPEDGGFLQLFSSKQRQAVLYAAGVKHIDKEEKRQLHALRLSREACGCNCQGFCEPETCACSLAGIRCQVCTRHAYIEGGEFLVPET